VCKFTGLENFPFDELGCTMEIGSWAYSGLYLRPVRMDEGYTVGGSETAGEAYAAFSVGEVSSYEKVYPPYPGDPDNDWPVVMYDVTFKRAWEPYARGYLTLQIILNLAAFACFWLPPQCGERMGLAITSLLAAVTSDVAIATNLPAAKEMTWFARFSISSLMFASAALFECAIVMYFFYNTSDDLVPRWAKWIWLKVKKKKEEEEEQKRGRNVCTSSGAQDKNRGVKEVPKDAEAADEELEEGSKGSDSFQDNEEGVELAQVSLEIPFGTDSKGIEISDRTEQGGNLSKIIQSNSRGADGTAVGQRNPGILKHRKKKKKPMLPSQESVFRWKEPVAAPPPPPPRLRRSLANSLGPQRQSLYQLYQQQSIRGNMFSNVSARTLEARDADDYKSEREALNNRRWQLVARNIDDFSRVFFPVVFAITIGSLLGPL